MARKLAELHGSPKVPIMARSLYSSIEALESRIAPASLTVFHPLLDLMPSMGKTSSLIDLGTSFDADSSGYRTHIEFLTNFDNDTSKAGVQPGKIVLELFDDKAPLTVQNFISYVNNANARGDFDNVFFHRLAAGFVLQTGGYEATDISKHIPVGEAVHNEFDPNDPERSNKVGTVAMAKVGGDPNSATSEFFFNLGDNSGNLDNQNGGFTVFGKVIAGMDVVNAIASTPTVTINSFAVPIQNGYDVTSGAVPKPNQLVSFTDVKVLAAKNSTIPNASYSVLSVTDMNGDPTDLVKTNANASTGKLTGDSLKLTYKPGASGIAIVKVQATNLADPLSAPTVQEFEVDVRPNLMGHAVSDTLPTVAVSGDTGSGTVKLVNTGAAAAVGTVDVKYYLSHIDGTDSSGNALGPDPTGTILDAGDLQIGSLMGAAVNIGSGKTGNLVVPLAIPANTTMDSGSYRLISVVTASDGSTISETFTDDNTITDGRVHGFFPGEAKANLTALGMTDNLPALIIPGDTGIAKIGIGNTSSTTALGSVLVQFYLSADSNPGNSSTDTLSANDILIGSLSQPLALEGGRSLTLDVPIQIPPILSLDLPASYYRVFGVITTPDGGTTISELTLDDNLAASNYHLLQFNFGTFTVTNTLLGNLSRTNSVLNYLDGDSNLISMKLTGKGFGAVSLPSVSESGGIRIALEGTDLKTSFSLLAAAGVRPEVENIFTGGTSGTPIGTLSLANTDWSGAVIAYGGVKNVILGNTTGDTNHFLGFGAFTAAAAKLQPVVTLGTVQDLSLVSNLTIASLTAQKWLDVNAATETVETTGLTNFIVRGNFEADLTVEAGLPSATAAVKLFQVEGALKNSTVRIAGNVTTVNLGAINSSRLLVGADIVPTALQDFNFARTITNLNINGGAPGETAGITDSDIAAARFGNINIDSSVAVDSGADNFGFIADRIAFYKRGEMIPLKNLDAATVQDQAGHYRVTVLA